MSRLSLLVFLLFMYHLQSNDAKTINLDIKLPVNGRSSIIDPNKDIKEVIENHLNSNEMNDFNLTINKKENKIVYKRDELIFENQKTQSKATNHRRTNDLDKQNNDSSNNDEQQDQIIEKSPKIIKKSFNSEPFDIRVVNDNVNNGNTYNATKDPADITFNDILSVSTEFTRREGDLKEFNLGPNMLEKNIHVNVPISEDLVDIRLRYLYRKSLDMGNRDSLGLYDLKKELSLF